MTEPLKTEKQKMLAGELYLARDPELAAENRRAHYLLREYNQLSIDDRDPREQVLRSLLGKVGKELSIVAPFHCDYGSNIFIGDNLEIRVGWCDRSRFLSRPPIAILAAPD
jgi:maltose O-acetyltransferase